MIVLKGKEIVGIERIGRLEKDKNKIEIVEIESELELEMEMDVIDGRLKNLELRREKEEIIDKLRIERNKIVFKVRRKKVESDRLNGEVR